MTTSIKLNEEEKSLVKSSLNIEVNIMYLALNKWENKLKEFEKEYKMPTEIFVDKFNKGELGDNKEWFDWLFAYKAYDYIKNKLELAKEIVI